MSYTEKQLIEMEFYAHAIPNLASTRNINKDDLKSTGKGTVSVPFTILPTDGVLADLDALLGQMQPRGPT